MGNETTQGVPPPLAGADRSESTSVPNAIIPPSLITEPGATIPILPGAKSIDVKLEKDKDKNEEKDTDRYVTLPGTASLSEVSSTLESNGVAVISLSDACAGCARHGPDGNCPSDEEEEEEFDLGSYPRKFDVDMESQLSGTTKPYARQVRLFGLEDISPPLRDHTCINMYSTHIHRSSSQRGYLTGRTK